MAYVKLTKEDWRQRYNEARRGFMKEHNLTARQVAQPLSKADVRGMTASQIKDMRKLFTKPMAKTETLPSGEKISKSAEVFQYFLIEGNINPSRQERYEKIKNEPFFAEGLQIGTVGWQKHMPKYDEFRPLQERNYRSLREAQSHMKSLKNKIYDPTKDVKFQEAFLKAIYRSGMSDEDKYDIAMRIKELPAEEVARIAMTHDEFDIAYVYSEVIGTNEARSSRIREYLGISDKHYQAGGISAQEQGYYEGISSRSGRPFLDKRGNVTIGYDINRVYKKIHGIAKK